MPSLLEVAKSNPFNSPIAASGDGLVEFGSAEYYGKCMIGGALSCGLTHTAVVPLDLVKCRMQVDAAKYPSLGKGLKVNIQVNSNVKMEFIGNCCRRWCQSSCSWLGSNPHWLLNAGNMQIRFLWNLQEPLFQCHGWRRRIPKPSYPLFGCLCFCRVLRWYCSVPNGSCQG